ncbi:hypothetical protein V5N11_006844 [Cardamine amara subsp. amara]|uniref:Uncharacterized protein n=1 Tax=Cardamine amara subsp. amara TaxID=228776 RepID=A0ABD1AUV0_CARAN
MKETNFVSPASCSDPRIRLTLTQVLEFRKELEFKRSKLEMIKQKRLTLKAEVRFLRRRYNHLKQDQTLETSPEMLRLSQSGSLGKRKKHTGVRASLPCFDLKEKNTIRNEKEALAKNASCDLGNKLKRSRGNEVLTNSVSLPDLNGDGNTSVTNKVPGFDLNQISREEEEPEANGEHMVAEATMNTMLGNGIGDLHDERKLPVYRDVEKELNRAVKRKVTWQDPVALIV